MKLGKIGLLALVIALATPKVAGANFFVSIGAGCLVAPGSASHVVLNGAVRFASTATGTIELYCPITMPISPPSTIELLYQDSTTSSGNYISAAYYKMNASNGEVTVFSPAISNNGSTTTGVAKTVTATFSDTYDNGNFRYYVGVFIVRNTTSATEAFHGISIY